MSDSEDEYGRSRLLADEPVRIPATVDVRMTSYVGPAAMDESFPEDLSVQSATDAVDVLVVDREFEARTHEGIHSGKQFLFTLRLEPREGESGSLTVPIEFSHEDFVLVSDDIDARIE